MSNKAFDHDSASLHIAAPANEIYELFADVTRTPEFSPEILSCKWLDGGDRPRRRRPVRGTQQVPNRPPWTNKPGPSPWWSRGSGSRFGPYRSHSAGTVRWTYEFEPDGGGHARHGVVPSHAQGQPDRLVHHRRALQPQGPEPPTSASAWRKRSSASAPSPSITPPRKTRSSRKGTASG